MHKHEIVELLKNVDPKLIQAMDQAVARVCAEIEALLEKETKKALDQITGLDELAPELQAEVNRYWYSSHVAELLMLAADYALHGSMNCEDFAFYAVRCFRSEVYDQMNRVSESVAKQVQEQATHEAAKAYSEGN